MPESYKVQGTSNDQNHGQSALPDSSLASKLYYQFRTTLQFTVQPLPHRIAVEVRHAFDLG